MLCEESPFRRCNPSRWGKFVSEGRLACACAEHPGLGDGSASVSRRPRGRSRRSCTSACCRTSTERIGDSGEPGHPALRRLLIDLEDDRLAELSPNASRAAGLKGGPPGPWGHGTSTWSLVDCRSPGRACITVRTRMSRARRHLAGQVPQRGPPTRCTDPSVGCLR